MAEGNKWSTYQLYQKPVDSGWAQVGFEIIVWRGTALSGCICTYPAPFGLGAGRLKKHEKKHVPDQSLDIYQSPSTWHQAHQRCMLVVKSIAKTYVFWHGCHPSLSKVHFAITTYIKRRENEGPADKARIFAGRSTF